MLPKLMTSPRQLWLLTCGAAVVFGMVVASVTLTLRTDLHQQMLQREVDVLSAVTAMLAESVTDEYQALGIPPETELIAAEVAVLAASVQGVLAVSIHDANGAFIWGAPEFLLPTPLDDEGNRVRFHRDFQAADLFNTNAVDESLPLLEARAAVEVAGEPMLIRFWLDGEPTLSALAAMDRRLTRQAGGAWLTGCLFLLGLSWLQQKMISARQEQLVRRTRELEQANRDLDFGAKSTALGAVAANLVHDLRNPLNVLRQSIANPGEGHAEIAQTAALKMESIIMEVVAIMRDQENVRAAPYDWEDIEAALRSSFDGNNSLRFSNSVDQPITGQQGGLLILILKQLIGNALRHSPQGKTVCVSAKMQADTLCVSVADEAGGIDPAMRDSLFRPVREAAQNGSGLGLALARQFCRALGGDLRLDSTNPLGSTFTLKIPCPQIHQHDATTQATHSCGSPVTSA